MAWTMKTIEHTINKHWRELYHTFLSITMDMIGLAQGKGICHDPMHAITLNIS